MLILSRSPKHDIYFTKPIGHKHRSPDSRLQAYTNTNTLGLNLHIVIGGLDGCLYADVAVMHMTFFYLGVI